MSHALSVLWLTAQRAKSSSSNAVNAELRSTDVAAAQIYARLRNATTCNCSRP